MESQKQNELKEALSKASKSVLILAIAGMVANFFAIIPLINLEVGSALGAID